MPPSRRRNAEATRQAILAAAEQIFVDHGFSGTHLSEIATKANVTKSLIHHHFGSKKDLWEQIKRQQFSQYAAEQNRLLEATDQETDLLEESIVQYFRYLQKNPRFSRLLTWMKIEADTSCGDIAEELAQLGLTRIHQAQQDGVLRKDINPLFVLMTFIGLVEWWFESKHQFVPAADSAGPESGQVDEAYLSSMLKIFFEGLLPR
ncbi:MAG: TetR/AcrR family transcriptional regulator [Proteobacteria bacterium]|nr:TetR/AcrR family transcriptional regulator [Pseudomonadota bacterium]